MLLKKKIALREILCLALLRNDLLVLKKAAALMKLVGSKLIGTIVACMVLTYSLLPLKKAGCL
jgi:hypothetical protein